MRFFEASERAQEKGMEVGVLAAFIAGWFVSLAVRAALVPATSPCSRVLAWSSFGRASNPAAVSWGLGGFRRGIFCGLRNLRSIGQRGGAFSVA